jgi:hypothetical protein
MLSFQTSFQCLVLAPGKLIKVRYNPKIQISEDETETLRVFAETLTSLGVFSR